MLAAIVDLGALWKILLVVLLVGVGLTALFGQAALFGQGVMGAERLAAARAAAPAVAPAASSAATVGMSSLRLGRSLVRRAAAGVARS